MASWFTEGTVTVTNGNAVVAGVGTKFSNCRSGDMFVGPDNGIYQVINPSSDTAISISPPFRGATAAGAAYGIVPVNGYPKALADAVNQMVQQWGSTLAGLGSVSTQNIVPVSMGGTGAATAAAAGASLGLKTGAYADIVGIVTSGAIFETGTNANGTYIRFADGTQICFGIVVRAAALTSLTGSIYYGYSASIGFPATFISAPAFFCQSYSAGVITWDGAGGSTSAVGQPLMLSSASLASRNFSCNYLAIGKWK